MLKPTKVQLGMSNRGQFFEFVCHFEELDNMEMYDMCLGYTLALANCIGFPEHDGDICDDNFIALYRLTDGEDEEDWDCEYHDFQSFEEAKSFLDSLNNSLPSFSV